MFTRLIALPTAAFFQPQLQGRAARTETVQPQNQKYLPPKPLEEEFANPNLNHDSHLCNDLYCNSNP